MIVAEHRNKSAQAHMCAPLCACVWAHLEAHTRTHTLEGVCAVRLCASNADEEVTLRRWAGAGAQSPETKLAEIETDSTRTPVRSPLEKISP